MELAWDPSSLCLLEKEGVICETCCLEWPPSSPTCPCEYFGGDGLTDCFDVGKTPLNLFVLFKDVKYCSDDSIITDLCDQLFCLSKKSGQWEWVKTIQVDGEDVSLKHTKDISDTWDSNVGAEGEFLPGNGIIFSSAYMKSEVLCNTIFANGVHSDHGDPDKSGCVYGDIGYGGHAIILDPCEVPCSNATNWIIDTNYSINNVVKISGASGTICYICYVAHLSSSSNKPGTGVDWEDYWVKIDVL